MGFLSFSHPKSSSLVFSIPIPLPLPRPLFLYHSFLLLILFWGRRVVPRTRSDIIWPQNNVLVNVKLPMKLSVCYEKMSLNVTVERVSIIIKIVMMLLNDFIMSSNKRTWDNYNQIGKTHPRWMDGKKNRKVTTIIKNNSFKKKTTQNFTHGTHRHTAIYATRHRPSQRAMSTNKDLKDFVHN
jgi:hypothetical protein